MTLPILQHLPRQRRRLAGVVAGVHSDGRHQREADKTIVHSDAEVDVLGGHTSLDRAVACKVWMEGI